MKAIPPQTGGHEVPVAEHQDEYETVVVAVHTHPDFPRARVLLTRWTFTDEERAAIAAGEDVYVGELLGQHAAMTPLVVTAGPPHGLPPVTPPEEVEPA